jgi:hypothetical protein
LQDLLEIKTCFFCYNVITDLSLKARKIRLPARVFIDFRKNKNGVYIRILGGGKTIAWVEGFLSLFHFLNRKITL